VLSLSALFIPESVDRAQVRRLLRRIDPKENTDDSGHCDRDQDRGQGDNSLDVVALARDHSGSCLKTADLGDRQSTARSTPGRRQDAPGEQVVVLGPE
jgi:hypothetical protein